MLDMIHSMMSNATLPKSFWGHALDTTALTINMVPSKSVEKTPYELWFGKSQICLILKMGLQGICHISDKLGPKSDKYFFVEYPKETK